MADSPHTLDVAVKPDVLRPTVVIAGEIDLESAAQVRAVIDEALADGAVSLDFDLTGVSFMDSTGLGLFANASDRTTAAGGSVRVRGASPTIIRLLEVSRLDTVIEVL